MLALITLLTILSAIPAALATSKIGKAIDAAILLTELDLDEGEKDSRMEPLLAAARRWATPAIVFGFLCPFLAGVGVAMAILR